MCADKYDPVAKRYFPPPLNLLLSWTTMFRSAQTLSNYLGYVQTGCLIANAPTQVGKMILCHEHCALLLLQVFQDPAVRKAKASAAAAGNFTRRERMFVSRQKVEDMLTWTDSNEELRIYALLFLLSYSFLLRTPSEAIPVIAGQDGSELGSNSVLFRNGDQLVLILHRRKNKPTGSRLARKCTCTSAAKSCVFHIIGSLLDATPMGQRLFGSVTASGAIA